MELKLRNTRLFIDDREIIAPRHRSFSEVIAGARAENATLAVSQLRTAAAVYVIDR